MSLAFQSDALFRVGEAGNDGREAAADLSRLVIDCGADTVKLGWAAPGLVNPSRLIPNAVAKGKGAARYVGEAVRECPDYSGLHFRRPMDRGFVLDWALQRQLWALDAAYAAHGHTVRPPRVRSRQFVPGAVDLLLSEPLFNPESLRRLTYECMFETIGFRSLLMLPASLMALVDWQHEAPPAPGAVPPLLAGVVVDSGHSATTAVPYWDATRITHAVRRIDVGGKFLTNFLKEAVSYRHWNMMNETYLMNHIREQLCYVPADYRADLATATLVGAANTVARSYVLPDGITSRLGRVGAPQGEEQVLRMGSERLVPELLFTPSDAGLRQGGVAEAVVSAVGAAPRDLHALLYRNVLLVGGLARTPGYAQRLYSELRALVPDDMELNVHVPRDPQLSAWRGGAKLQQLGTLAHAAVSRAEYDERGPNHLLCMRRFDAI